MEQSIHVAGAATESNAGNPLEMLQSIIGEKTKVFGKKTANVPTDQEEGSLATFLQILNQQLASIMSTGENNVGQTTGAAEMMQTMLSAEGTSPDEKQNIVLSSSDLLKQLSILETLSNLDWSKIVNGEKSIQTILKDNPLLNGLLEEKTESANEDVNQLNNTVTAMLGGVEASMVQSVKTQTDAASEKADKLPVADQSPDILSKSFIQAPEKNAASEILQPNSTQSTNEEVVGLSSTANASLKNEFMREVQSAVEGVTKTSGDGEEKIKVGEGVDVKTKVTTVDASLNSSVLNSVHGANISSAQADKFQAISPSDLINRVATEFKENNLSDGGRIKVTLTPPSLGTLEMDVTVRNNKVEIVLIADNKDVQQTLNTNIDHLKSTLQKQGLTIDRCDVLMQSNRDGYSQNFSQQAQAFYRDGSEKNSNQGKEKCSEEFKSIEPVKTQIINSPLLNQDNISIFA